MKMNKYKFSLFICVAYALTTISQASPFLAMNPSSMAMSGAQTGLRTGIGAMQGNPAIQGLDKRFSMALPFTLQISAEGDLIDIAQNLSDKFTQKEIETAFARLKSRSSVYDPSEDIATIVNFLTVDAKQLDQPGQGFQSSVQGGLHFNWARFGLSLSNQHYLGAEAVYDSNFIFESLDGSSLLASGLNFAAVDVDNSTTVDPNDSDLRLKIIEAGSISSGFDKELQSLIDEAQKAIGSNDLSTDTVNLLGVIAKQLEAGGAAVGSSSSSIDNDSGLLLRWIDIKSVDFGYGFSFFDDNLHLAPVLKYLHGTTYSRRLRVTDAVSGSSNVLDELKTLPDPVSSGAFGLDVGLLWSPGDRFGLGLTVNNLFSPTFESKIGGDIGLSPSMRIGSSFTYSLNKWLPGTIAVDADILSVDSIVIPGAESRMISFGISQGITPAFTFRGGVGKNLVGGDGVQFSGGLALRIKYFYMDAAGAISTDTFKLDDEKYPSAGGFGFSLGWNMNL